jgi:DNA-binding transcriptional MocR family regulator
MSKNYVKAVLDYVSLSSPTDTSVLVAIAEYTSDETRIAWPSVAALSRRTRLDRRTVQRSLRRLEARGLLSTTLGSQDDQGRNTASVYRLEFDHHGNQHADVKMPPKRTLQPAPAPPIGITAQSQSVTARARLKKILTAEPALDLNAEKQRQLAALRKITP